MTSSYVDSTHTFSAKLAELAVSDALAKALVDQQVDTVAKYAWVVGLVPGTKDADAAFVEYANKLKQEPLSAGELASLRRAWAECHALWIADMKHKVERTGDTQPRKVAPPERDARQADQQSRLKGVSITGSFEPAHSLIDAIANMREEGVLRYLDPATCISRVQELQQVKRDSFLKVGPNGMLQTVPLGTDSKADTSTEYRARQALQRRALAFDQFDVVPYEKMEMWHNYLFDLTQRPAAQGYQAISMQQILEADRQVFLVASQILGSKGVSRRTDGSHPVADALQVARDDPLVTAILRPLPRIQQNPSKRGADAPDVLPQQKVPRTEGKGKGKNKRSRYVVPVPEPLRGLQTRTADNKNICFGFNLAAGCPHSGSQCPKGVHVCMRCSGSHGAHQCTKQ